MLQHLWWIFKVSGVDTVTTITAGVGSAQNDTSDSVATNAWFKIDGATSLSNVVVETDDATNDLDDKATGKTITTAYTKCLIDFTQGIQDVRFEINGDRVAAGTTFDMSALTAGLNVQPWVQIQKASGTGIPVITIAQYGVRYAWGY
jgi:hypothetical protein